MLRISFFTSNCISFFCKAHSCCLALSIKRTAVTVLSLSLIQMCEMERESVCVCACEKRERVQRWCASISSRVRYTVDSEQREPKNHMYVFSTFLKNEQKACRSPVNSWGYSFIDVMVEVHSYCKWVNILASIWTIADYEKNILMFL